jgi:hypothetical protein
VDRVAGISRVLIEFARRRGLHQLARQAAREAHPLALDVAAGLFEQLEGVGRLAELDPDGLEDRVGVVLDRRKAFLREDLERLQGARDEGDLLDDLVQPGCPATFAAAPWGAPPRGAPALGCRS